MVRAVRIACVAAAFVACSAAEQSAAGGTVSQDELLGRMRSEAAPIVLDVRTSGEYASGRVPGARNVPVAEVAARANEISADRSAEVVVYCERGPRARKAQDALEAAGFTNVRHLDGDMSAWREKQLPCEGC
jgi:hydroxyacylglutathione hydrolase